MTSNRVQVDSKAVLRALSRGHGEEAWVRILVEDGLLQATDVGAAVARANEDSLGGNAEALGAVEAPVDGGFAVLIQRPGTKTTYLRWLDKVADLLTERGAEGTITAAPHVLSPAWYRNDPTIPPQPTALVAFRTSDLSAMTMDEARFVWAVPPEPTRRIVEAVANWTRLEGAKTHLGVSGYTTVAHPRDIEPMLNAALPSEPRASIEQFTSKPRRMRRAGFGIYGSAGMQIVDQTTSWPDRVNDLIEGMCRLPDLIEQASLVHMGKAPPQWSGIGSTVPRPPFAMEHHFRTNPNLRRRFVPDAYAAQVLTREHLERANSLSNWEVTDLGHGRLLVAAPDLAPWFLTGEPDPSVLARARADFGEMILTDEVADSVLGPWG